MIIEDWQIYSFVKVVFSVIKRHANCTKHKFISPIYLTVKEPYEILFEIMLQMFQYLQALSAQNSYMPFVRWS